MVPTTAYAVAVSQVMDLHLVIRRTLQYGLAKTSVWCAILLPLFYLVFDIYNNRSLRVEEYLTVRRPFEPLLLSLVSFGILTFRHQILQHVDRWFSRDASDHTESLARLEQGLRSARTIRDISGILKREIERALHPSSVAVLMVDPSGRNSSSRSRVRCRRSRMGSALLDILRSIRTEIQISYRADGPVAGLLASRRSRMAHEHRVRVLFTAARIAGHPARSRRNRREDERSAVHRTRPHADHGDDRAGRAQAREQSVAGTGDRTAGAVRNRAMTQVRTG